MRLKYVGLTVPRPAVSKLIFYYPFLAFFFLDCTWNSQNIDFFSVLFRLPFLHANLVFVFLLNKGSLRYLSFAKYTMFYIRMFIEINLEVYNYLFHILKTVDWFQNFATKVYKSHVLVHFELDKVIRFRTPNILIKFFFF